MKTNLNMNDVLISNLVFVNNYTIPTSTRSSKAPKELFLQSLTSGLGEINQGGTGTNFNVNRSVYESQRLLKNEKSTGKLKKVSQKKIKVMKPHESIFSQRLFSSGPNLDFFTSSHSKLPQVIRNSKKQKMEAKPIKTKDLNALLSTIKSKSVQKKLIPKQLDLEPPEKSSSRSKKKLTKLKFEPRSFKVVGDNEFMSSDNKFKFTKLSPRGDFDTLVKKLKLTCQKSDY